VSGSNEKGGRFHGLVLVLSVAVACVLLVACTSSSTPGGSSTGSNGPSCVQQGTVFTGGKFTMPTCGGVTFGPCDLSADSGCGACKDSAGYECRCAPGDGGAGEWLCLGTGGSCQVN
jgi:hypothetical protein